MRHQTPDFSVELPADWAVVEGDAVESPDPDAPAEPVAFAKHGGAGVLQVTAALHPPGKPMLANGMDVREVLDDYAKARGFAGRPGAATTQDRPVALAAGTYAGADGVTERAWCLSVEGNVAFVTYACPAAELAAGELAEAEAVVRSIRFERAGEDESG